MLKTTLYAFNIYFHVIFSIFLCKPHHLSFINVQIVHGYESMLIYEIQLYNEDYIGREYHS